MRRASVIPVLVAATFVMLCIALIFVLNRPVEAQTADPLARKSAPIRGDEQAGTVASVGPITVADCAVAANATVEVEDEDGTRATLSDGINVRITATATEITIAGTADDGVIVGENVTGGDPTTFDIGPGTVVRSTGITCGTDNGDDNGGQGGNTDPDRDQYNDDREITVIIKTIPDKPLPKTGGIPPLLGAGVLLAFAALVSVGILRR